MFTSLILLWAACCSSIAFGAPTDNTIDASTLLQNGLDAQALNAEFLSISANDPCNSGQMACINGAPSLCQFGSWQLQKCTDSRECFAVPPVKSRGTSLVCTSYANAVSLISATGAKGGLTPSNGTNTTLPLPTMTPSAPSSTASLSANSSLLATSLPPSASLSSSAAPSPSGQAQDGVQFVTVTVTIPNTPNPTVTLPPVITTISPSDAASILSSLSVNGASTILPSSSASFVPSSSGVPTPSASANQTTSDPSSGERNGIVDPSSAPAPSATPVSSGSYYRRAIFGGRRMSRKV